MNIYIYVGREQLKTYIVSAAIFAGFTGMAHAEDNSLTMYGITLYGTVDVGVTYETHGVTNSPYSSAGTEYLVSKNSNQSLFAFAPNGLGNSKIGLKGIEEIGDGFSALFKLETGFNPASGQLSDGIRSVAAQNGLPLNQQSTSADSSRAGQIFNQAIYGGFTHSTYGTVTFGRQTTLQADGVSAYDPQQGSYAFSVIGYSGTAGGAGATEDLRLDNSIKYWNNYGPYHLGLMYQFAGTVGHNDDGYAVDIGADYAGLSVDAVATHKKDEVNVASLSAAQVLTLPTGSLAATISDNTSYSLMARYSMGRVKFYGGYEYIKFANPGSPLPAGTQDIGGYDLSSVNNNAYGVNKILQYSWVGARYKLTPQIDLAGAFYHIDQNSYKSGGCSTTVAATCSGQENAVSLMVDYRFAKRFDAYAGAMYSQVVDGLASGYLHNNTIDPTVGVRFTF
jgi:predicted porin